MRNGMNSTVLHIAALHAFPPHKSILRCRDRAGSTSDQCQILRTNNARSASCAQGFQPTSLSSSGTSHAEDHSRNSRFQENYFAGQQELFERLAAGQNPETLFITCSDSRINPNLLTQTEPGELFILRNAGNIVPP
ncbi:MAG: carbonic anhydrase [Planctomycetaceae bacterium]